MTYTATLVLEAQKGNNRAFNELVDAWYARIYNFAYKYFNAHDMATEVAQRTFIAAHKHLSNLESAAQFKPWLYRIALNNCHQEKRQQVRSPWHNMAQGLFEKGNKGEQEGPSEPIQVAATASHQNPEQHIGQEDLGQWLEQALAEINPDQRAIVIMKEYEGLKFREIAETLGLSENTVKSRLYYGLKALRSKMEAWNLKPENF